MFGLIELNIRLRGADIMNRMEFLCHKHKNTLMDIENIRHEFNNIDYFWKDTECLI